MDATIELDNLALFLRVGEHKSFTKAARELGVPTSTVSRAVARLEDRLGARLIQRTTRKLALTAEGAALFEGAKAPMLALSAVAQAVGEGRGAPRGTLRVTAPVDMGPGLMAEMVSSFVARYPAVRVDIALTNRTVDLVGEGFDVALRAGFLIDSSLVAVKVVGGTPIRLYASPAYLERRGTPASPADLAHHDGVMFRMQAGTGKWRLEGGGEVVEVAPVTRVIADDFGFVRGAVLQGAGIGMMPALLAVDDVPAGRLVRVLPAYESSGGSFFVVYPSARNVPAKVRVFRDHVLERFHTLMKRVLP